MEDKILLVDDDEFVLSCFQRMLRRAFSLDTAAGPLEALQTISTRGPYAVVVTDMRMPGLNGIQLLIKARESMPDMIGVILSGNLNDTEAAAAGCKVVFKVLAKPCPYDQLSNVIKEAIAYHHELQRRDING